MNKERWGTVLAFAAGLFLFGWFLYAIRDCLSSWFDGDDLMNCYYYWSRSWAALWKANLFFWSTYYRPGGGIFYRLIYAGWGFHPLPFRVGMLILLCLDFGLLAIVVRQLTGSRRAALLALLLVGVNPSFGVAYFDGGAIYDVLAYAFFWGAFAGYVRVRQSGRIPGVRDSILVICGFIMALNSKEVSVTFPVAIGLYELLWHTPRRWRWILKDGLLTCVCGLIDVVYVIGKKYGPDSLWQKGPYHPHFSVAAYITSLNLYFRQLIYQPLTVSDGQMVIILAVMLAVAILSRRRYLLWAFGFILAGVLPLAFIRGRAGFAYMVPSVGWAVYSCGLVDWLLTAAMRRRVALRTAVQAALLIAAFAILAPWQKNYIDMQARAVHDMLRRFVSYQQQIDALFPAPPRKDARILLLTDADGHDDYNVYFLMMLRWGNPELRVDRMTVSKQRNINVDPATYDYVVDWVNGHFVLVSHK